MISYPWGPYFMGRVHYVQHSEGIYHSPKTRFIVFISTENILQECQGVFSVRVQL